MHTGDEQAYVDLGTHFDIAHKHEIPKSVDFTLNWKLPKALKISDPESSKSLNLFTINDLGFQANNN
ncbi:MAG: hypothetical protein WCD18_23715 [Thermosynechococcaceae cyanobacterium]